MSGMRLFLTSGIAAPLFAIFLALSFLFSLLPAREVVRGLPTANLESFLKGQLTHVAFEKGFASLAPGYEPSRTFWGVLSYLLFNEGRAGAVIGAEGWLFSAEELSWPKDAEKNVEANLGYIAQINSQLREKNILLLTVPVPAKARIFEDTLGDFVLPVPRKSLYGRIFDLFNAQNIRMVELTETLRRTPESFFRTDTHWTPRGASVAAALVAAELRALPQGNAPERTDFETKARGPAENFSGDLLRYVPLGSYAALGPSPDSLMRYETQAVSSKAQSEEALFGDSSLPVVALVGTSYSADERWNFAGFLRQELKADILNAADPGLGPFATMKAYLDSPAFRDTPPRIIVWEIPERYFPIDSAVRVSESQGKSP